MSRPGPRPSGTEIRRRVWDVFISHTREDSGIARDLAAELERRGFSTWTDVKLKSGDPLSVVDDAVYSSAAVIVLLSKSSLSSKWVGREVDAALRALPAYSIFPVAVGELDVRSLPPWLADRRYFHLRDRSRVRNIVELLLPALEASLDASTGGQGGVSVFGELPPREPVVGAERYLRELLGARTGMTWIVGMPGTGKTTIAREYAHLVRDDVAFILWLRAFARRVSDLIGQLDMVRDSSAFGGPEPGLVIVDGLDELVDDPTEIVGRLAELETGNRILITMRGLPDPRLMEGAPSSILTVGPLSQSAVSRYLETRLPNLPPRDIARVREIADATGGSPLVLQLITKAMQTSSLAEVLEPHATPEMAFARTIDVLLDRLTAEQRQRLNVLVFCSGLLNTIRTGDPWRLPGDDLLFNKLLDLGLLQASADGEVSAHPIVLGYLRQHSSREALGEAIGYVSARLPEPNNENARTLLPNVVELTELAEFDWGPKVSAGLAELLIWQASAWRSAGDYERAELHCPRALELATKSNQPLLRIRALNLQSALAFDRGRISEASTIERHTAELATDTFGPEHPITTASLANLAVSLRALGELPEAITLLRRVVDQNQRALSREHPDVIASQLNLATCLREAGLLHEALALLDEVWTHLTAEQSRLRVAQNLAATLADMGRLEESLSVLQTALDRPGTAIDSLDVLTTRATLATVSARLGRLQEAFEILSDVVDRSELMLGPEHPFTLNARSNQAMLLTQIGMTQEALPILLDVADGRARVLGHDHPDAVQSQLLAARALRDAGQNDRALGMYSDLVARVGRTLGPEHAMTLTVREEYARQLRLVGNAHSASIAYKELLADLDRVLPADHPMVKRVRATVAEFA